MFHLEFYEINKDWISGAAKYSRKSSPPSEDYIKQIKQLPDEVKNGYLKIKIHTSIKSLENPKQMQIF